MMEGNRHTAVDAPDRGWCDHSISPSSKCGDDIWVFEILRAGFQRDAMRFDWTFPPPSDCALEPAHFLSLKLGAKEFLRSMQVCPPAGRRPNGPTTLLAKALLLKVLIGWMALQGTASYANLGVREVENFTAWLRRREDRRSLQPRTVASYLELIEDLHRQRAKISDAPRVSPLGGRSVAEVAGLADRRRIPHLPDEIALPLLKAALEWVQTFSGAILEASSIYQRAREQEAQRFKIADDLKRASISLPDGTPLNSFGAVRVAERHLMEACFIVVAGFVGMRASEILALKTHSIEVHGPNRLTYLASTLFKGVRSPKGSKERWLAPPAVVQAVGVLEALTAPLRHRSGRAELFIVPSSAGEGGAAGVLTNHMNQRLNEFGARAGIPQISSGEWRLSTHQFRKTFGRNIARRDRSQLLGLSEHFKHASVGVTARDYVGTSFELSELMESEAQAETVDALQEMLGAPRLAGRMGARLSKLNARFRGRTGDEVRRDYIDWVLRDTDLVVHACDYGWCVFQRETAQCGGILAPNEALRSPAACLSCANMSVGDRHRPYWEERKAQNLALLGRANEMTKAVLQKAIGECDAVLAQIESTQT